jgi:hypothetical protein
MDAERAILSALSGRQEHDLAQLLRRLLLHLDDHPA